MMIVWIAVYMIIDGSVYDVIVIWMVAYGSVYDVIVIWMVV